MAFKALSKSEKAYIQTSLQAQSPLRADGRSLHEFRAVTLQTGVVSIANGSAHLNLGRSSDESIGGTEVLAAAKLEVEDTAAANGSSGVEGGRIVCMVSWCVGPYSSRKETETERGAKKSSPAAYSYLSATALDDLQHDYSAILNDVLSHASLRPPNLGIIPGRKAWLLTLDLMVLSDAGNVYDALFMAARAALWDTRVPRTRAVEYRADRKDKGGDEMMDVDPESQSALDTRRSKAPATDFELEDSSDDGVVLGGRDAWPVSVTLNLVNLVFILRFFFFFADEIPNKVSGCALSGRYNTRGGCNASASDPDILLHRGIASRSSRDAPTRYRRHRSFSNRVVSKGE